MRPYWQLSWFDSVKRLPDCRTSPEGCFWGETGRLANHGVLWPAAGAARPHAGGSARNKPTPVAFYFTSYALRRCAQCHALWLAAGATAATPLPSLAHGQPPPLLQGNCCSEPHDPLMDQFYAADDFKTKSKSSCFVSSQRGSLLSASFYPTLVPPPPTAMTHST